MGEPPAGADAGRAERAAARLQKLATVSGLRWGVATIAGDERPRLAVAAVDGRRPLTRAVFTRNAFAAAPVTVAQDHLARGEVRYWLVNSGVANAGTGPAGIRDAEACCAALAERVDGGAASVAPCSTGLIGAPLPRQAIIQALPQALEDLSADGWQRAAAAIMTTDTVPKGASISVPGTRGPIQLTGIAKGAGMLRPDMATLLAFVGTDAEIDPAAARAMLVDAVDGSFNRINVDGDTSTNDSCVLLASGDAGRPASEAEFGEALSSLCASLARQLLEDAEGATKYVTVTVSGGRGEVECLQVAHVIAESPLVKTALFGEDPNWGRMLAAVGRAGVADLAPQGVHIRINGIAVVDSGERAASYDDEAARRAQASMAANEIALDVSLGRGTASARVHTTDMSLDYIRINAHYTS